MSALPLSSPDGRRLKSHDHGKRGAVLIFVLVVLATLSLAAYTFSESMLSEYRASRAATDQVKLFNAAESGVDVFAGGMARNGSSKRQTVSDENGEASLSWMDSSGLRNSVIIQPLYKRDRSLTKGLIPSNAIAFCDESSKLNVNSLGLDEEVAIESRQRLMALPSMTAAMADAILDWMDPDDSPRDFGVESSGYGGAGLPYGPRQGPFRSLHELALVRGIDHRTLFGEDANGNGWLDPNEDDGKLSFPDDNQDGVLDAGWSRWLTVHSAESNLDDRGVSKVYINQDTLVTLYNELEARLGAEGARFIVALRMNGPMNDEDVAKFDSEEGIRERKATAAARANRQLSESKRFEAIQRAKIEGFDIQTAGSFQIRSMADLIGSRTEASIENQDTILRSPWKDEMGNISEALRWLESQLTPALGPTYPGRININVADYEVLMTIPKMTPELAKKIVAQQNRPSGVGKNNVSARGAMDAAYLYRTGQVDRSLFRRLSPFITSHGDVFRGSAVASLEGCRQSAAVCFLVNATDREPEILQLYRVSQPFVSEAKREAQP